METENIKDKLEDITSHASEYLDTRIKLTVANITQKSANIASSVVSNLITGTLVVFGILLSGFGLGWWLGDLIGSRAGGFMLTGGFFLLVAVVLFLVRKKLIYPSIRNSIVRKFYE